MESHGRNAAAVASRTRRADVDKTVAVKYGDSTWTWREHLAEATAQAAALIAAADPDRPLHVGALLGNTPDMLAALAAAGLGGYVLCGINTTRRGEALARDIAKVDCQFLITDAEHRTARRRRSSGVTVFDTSSSRVGRAAGRRTTALAAPRGRRRGHVHDDLHLGNQRRAQGRSGATLDGAVRGTERWSTSSN